MKQATTPFIHVNLFIAGTCRTAEIIAGLDVLRDMGVITQQQYEAPSVRVTAMAWESYRDAHGVVS